MGEPLQNRAVARFCHVMGAPCKVRALLVKTQSSHNMGLPIDRPRKTPHLVHKVPLQMSWSISVIVILLMGR